MARPRKRHSSSSSCSSNQREKASARWWSSSAWRLRSAWSSRSRTSEGGANEDGFCGVFIGVPASATGVCRLMGQLGGSVALILGGTRSILRAKRLECGLQWLSPSNETACVAPAASLPRRRAARGCGIFAPRAWSLGIFGHRLKRIGRPGPLSSTFCHGAADFARFRVQAAGGRDFYKKIPGAINKGGG